MEIVSELKNFLDQQGRLTALPAKRKMRIYALCYLAGKFAPKRTYTEKEVGELLGQWHTFADPWVLRRELYDNKFINREKNGSAYWLNENQPDMEELLQRYG